MSASTLTLLAVAATQEDAPCDDFVVAALLMHIDVLDLFQVHGHRCYAPQVFMG